MKYQIPRLVSVLILLALLPIAPARAASEQKCWAGFFDYYYHAAQQCALAGTTSEVTLNEALAQNKTPCPVCVDDSRRYKKVESIVRGGTVVIRVPDAWLRAREDDAYEIDYVAEPWQAQYTGARADAEVAEQLHGEGYRAFLDVAAAKGEAYTGDDDIPMGCVPELVPGDGDLVMNRRHIGGAWYLTLRPSEEGRKRLEKKKKLDVDLKFSLNQLALRDGILSVGKRNEWEDKFLTLKPDKSKAAPTGWQRDGLELSVFQESGANICVIHLSAAAPSTEGAALLIDGVDSGIRMDGYPGDGDAIFCCVLTDGEMSALEAGAGFELAWPDAQPASADSFAAAFQSALSAGDAAEEAAGDPDPVTEAECASGLFARMDRVDYPPAPTYLSFTLSNDGPMKYYNVPGALEAWDGEGWRAVAGNYHYCARNPDQLKGYTAEGVRLAMPLNNLQPLTMGLYRVKVESFEGEGIVNADTWLEFRVSADAEPLEPMPEAAVELASGTWNVADHAPAFADAPDYNSCMDTSRFSTAARNLVQAGDVVYELRGLFMDDWDWVPTGYWLVSYPAGHPEQPHMVLSGLDASFCTLYDTGDGLLIWTDSEDRLLRVSYDGKAISRAENLYDEPARTLYDLLPVGEWLYACDGEAVWRAPLSGGRAEKVYTTDDHILNSREGAGLVYADGVLYVADRGIVAVDTEDLTVTRLIDEYDRESGECGLGYIVLGGELYTWVPSKGCTAAIDVATGEGRKVSDTRFYFSQVTEDGVVLALTGKNDEGLFGGYDAADFYLPADPAHPAFDPDHCEKRSIESYDFVLGDWLYQAHDDGLETVSALPW